MGRWQDDHEGGAYCIGGRHKIRDTKVQGTLWLRTGGDETGGKRTGYSRSTVCGTDGVQEIGPSDTITIGSRHAWRQEEWTRGRLVQESIDETLSEAGEDMEVGNTPEPKPSGEELTTQELLKDLSEENWADTATPPLTPSPWKNLELPLASGTSNMGMILLSSEEREKNTYEGNKDMFLGTLEDDAWQNFLKEFNREVGSETTLDKFKDEL